MKTPQTTKQTHKLASEAKQTYRARMNLAREQADIIDKKCQDFIFPVYVFRTIMKELR